MGFQVLKHTPNECHSKYIFKIRFYYLFGIYFTFGYMFTYYFIFGILSVSNKEETSQLLVFKKQVKTNE